MRPGLCVMHGAWLVNPVEIYMMRMRKVRNNNLGLLGFFFLPPVQLFPCVLIWDLISDLEGKKKKCFAILRIFKKSDSLVSRLLQRSKWDMASSTDVIYDMIYFQLKVTCRRFNPRSSFSLPKIIWYSFSAQCVEGERYLMWDEVSKCRSVSGADTVTVILLMTSC